jgi:hypothetical protein
MAPPTIKLATQEEINKLMQYIGQVYQLQKRTLDQLVALDKRVAQLEASIKKAVEVGLEPALKNLQASLEKQTQKIISEMVLPVVAATEAGFKTVPRAAPVEFKPGAAAPRSSQPAPKAVLTPPPQKVIREEPSPPRVTPRAAEQFAEPRQTSEIPSPGVATVLETLDHLVREIRGRQKVQREFLKPLLEQARDTAMNNLSNRAVAANVFKELIALAKSSPFDMPADTVAAITSRLEDLRHRISG